MRDTAQLIGKSSFFVQKWSKRGENGTFERKKAAEDLLKFLKLPLKSLSTSAINLQEKSVES